MRNYMEEYQRWLDSPALSNAEWEELNAIRDDKKEIESRFFAPLEFGTAGLRGEMALGCRRMNIHVIRHATQAFAEVIKAEGESACARGIAICFDCRVNSERFAHEAASVMAANGIHVRIFDALRPTPELSFAVRELGCIAGINLLGAGYEPMLISTMAPGGFMIFGLTLGVANIIMKSIEKKKKAKEAA